MANSLDLRGMHCPITTMRLKKYLKTLPAGESVEVLADDDEARVDFPATIEKSGAKLTSFTHAPDYDIYHITRSE